MLPLLLTFCVVGVSFGCQPVAIHYQSTYCSSPLAAVIKIDREIPPSDPFAFELEYEGTVLDTVKGSDMPKGSIVTVATAGPSHSCGPMILKDGTTYMVLGELTAPSRFDARLFNGAVEVSNNTEDSNIRRRMESYDCTCDVQAYVYRMQPYDLPLQQNECRATATYSCQWEEGACVRNAEGKCTYVHDCPAGSPQLTTSN